MSIVLCLSFSLGGWGEVEEGRFKGKEDGPFLSLYRSPCASFSFFLSSFFFLCVCLIQYVAKKKHFQPLYLKAFHKTGF